VRQVRYQGTGVLTQRIQFGTTLVTCFALVMIGSAPLAATPGTDPASSSLLLESPGWNDADSVVPNRLALPTNRASIVGVSGQSGAPLLPPQNMTTPAPPAPSPLFDNGNSAQELLSPGIQEENCERRGVQPYGGGSPGDWSWGCGGSPYRTGPGLCDDWKVGPRWHIATDGLVLSRDDANLGALAAATDVDSAGNPLIDPRLDQFEYGPGGRITFMSQVPQYVGYQMYAAYEGIEEWDSSIVFPRFSPMPGSADPFTSEQRALHYESSMHSGEIDFVRYWHPMLQPYCGVRYIRFNDEIHDFIDQQAPLGTITNDRLNLLDLENNLMGFQIGGGYQLGQLGERLAVVGYFNGGVYYNKIKYTNQTGVITTAADGTVTSVVNDDRSEPSEISYVSESSITAICKLNRCWALRAGYQTLWIANVHLAEDAFLNTGNDDQNLFFHGWHAGIECHR
jgi:hypothetical protein